MPTLAPPPLRSTIADRIVVEQLSSPSFRVDREAGIIRGCKIAGFRSGNKAKILGFAYDKIGEAANKPYRYSRRAFESARSLYEGANVYSNHLPFAYNAQGERFMAPPDSRVNESLVGWFSNVTVGADGLYGDFNYVKSHAMAPVICEVAERNPNIFKFSHEARWDEAAVEGGELVLNKIKAVDGIALVCVNAGTTQSLFESLAPENEGSANMVTRTMRQVVESLAEETPGRKAIMEMMGSPDYQSMGDATVEAPAEASAEDLMSSAFEGALVAIWRDKKLDVAAKATKIKDLLKALEKVNGDGTPTAPASGGDKSTGDDSSKDTEKDKKAQEALSSSADAALWDAARNGNAPATALSTAPAVTSGSSSAAIAQGGAVVDRGPVVMESVALLVGAGLSELSADNRIVESLVAQPDKASREAYVKTLAGLRTVPGLVPRSTPAAPVVVAPAANRVAESAAAPVVKPEDFAAICRGVRPLV